MDQAKQDSWFELFPMPMTSIEKFHWFDDRADYPNVVFTRLRFDGAVDKDVARLAWQYAIERQPFGDVEPKQINGTWNWTLGPRGDGTQNSAFETWNGTRFEFKELPAEPEQWIYNEHPIRGNTGSYLGVFVWPKSADAAQEDSAKYRTEVWLRVHHAITDGIGALIPVNEWMVVYGNLIGGRPPTMGLQRMDPQLLKRRNHLGLMRWQYLKHLWKQPVALFGATKFAFRKTAQLVPEKHQAESRSPTQDPASYPSIIGTWLNDSQPDRIAAEAKSLNVMQNSVLLGQLYLSLAQWREKQGFHSSHDWLRIILPMSIRNVSDRRLPSANRATIVQIDRRGKDAKDLHRFYHLLDREIRIIRGWQLEKIFLIAIRALSFLEPMLQRGVENDKSRGMAVFTNLGEPLRKNEKVRSLATGANPGHDTYLRPHEFDLVGPIRPGTPVNFSVARYDGRLRVSMHYDSRLLAPQAASELFKIYVDRLNAL